MAAPGVKAIPYLWRSWLPISESSSVFSYLWWGRMCPLLSDTTVMRYQHYLHRCETSLVSRTSQSRPAQLPLLHFSPSSSPQAILLYLCLGRECCTWIPLPVTSSDDAHHICSWGPEHGWAAGHLPAPLQQRMPREPWLGWTIVPPLLLLGWSWAQEQVPSPKIGRAVRRSRTQQSRCVREKTFTLRSPSPSSQV